MIETKQLTIRSEQLALNGVNLRVNNGEIYLLMFKNDTGGSIFTDVLAGYQPIAAGQVVLDSTPLQLQQTGPVTIINRLEDLTDFEPDLKLKDLFDFNCNSGDLNRNRALEILLLFNLFDVDLKKKIRHCDPVDFKAFYLSMLLAKENDNIVFNDFIRGEERAFELKFNRVLNQLKNEGKAILYLTGDIFYAYRIADRVSFLKNGYIVPAEPIVSRDFEELDAMEVYKKYLS